jgi:hypothetical protein
LFAIADKPAGAGPRRFDSQGFGAGTWQTLAQSVQASRPAGGDTRVITRQPRCGPLRSQAGQAQPIAQRPHDATRPRPGPPTPPC